MNTEKICRLHGVLNNGSAFCYYIDKMYECPRMPYDHCEGTTEYFADEMFAYSRSVSDLGNGFYRIDNEWKNVSGETKTLNPMFRACSLDRYIGVSIRDKKGSNVAPDKFVYAENPQLFTDIHVSGMSVTDTYMQAMALFTTTPGAAAGLGKTWEGGAVQYLMLPTQQLAANETYAATTYIYLTKPNAEHGGIDGAYKAVDAFLATL